ncbi:F0F1 ATP synthase subunit delta [Arboricoccus pini]|uniref:F0F1 ATP synthase subunit delta n=1 Tax=Arboricoccus pini TaxID=1963835 RepID=UPI001FAF486B|nr:F0F1 ATP synthase subunit delta [Arboricoccus pini]
MPANSAAASGLATRYATAIFELAEQHGELDAVASDLEGLRRMFAGSQDLQRLTVNPSLSRGDEEKAMAALSEAASFSALTRNFLGVLASHRRLHSLDSIAQAFVTRLAEQRGQVQARVVTASPLPAKDLAALKSSLAAYAGKTVDLDVAVDPSLLGGLVVTMGSRMIDASLKSKLKGLELSMRGVG